MTPEEYVSAGERAQMVATLAVMLAEVPPEVMERAIATRDFMPVAEEVIRQGEAWVRS